MKAHLVYKCTRCGEIIVMTDTLLDVDEIACVENIKTHVCDVGVFISPEKPPSYKVVDQVGIIKLVGYNEVADA